MELHIFAVLTKTLIKFKWSNFQCTLTKKYLVLFFHQHFYCFCFLSLNVRKHGNKWNVFLESWICIRSEIYLFKWASHKRNVLKRYNFWQNGLLKSFLHWFVRNHCSGGGRMPFCNYYYIMKLTSNFSWWLLCNVYVIEIWLGASLL